MTELKDKCLLPSVEVKQFLLEVLEQTNFRGSMVEFVADVKQLIKEADVV